MTAKTFLATIATVALTVAATAVTVTSAVAAEPTQSAAHANTAASAASSAVVEQSKGLTRAQVIAQTLEARKQGLIPETEADFDVAQTKKQIAK